VGRQAAADRESRQDRKQARRAGRPGLNNRPMGSISGRHLRVGACGKLSNQNKLGETRATTHHSPFWTSPHLRLPVDIPRATDHLATPCDQLFQLGPIDAMGGGREQAPELRVQIRAAHVYWLANRKSCHAQAAQAAPGAGSWEATTSARTSALPTPLYVTRGLEDVAIPVPVVFWPGIWVSVGPQGAGFCRQQAPQAVVAMSGNKPANGDWELLLHSICPIREQQKGLNK
jgi:hypothetical protein